MTIPSHSSYDWVREIKPDLKKLDSIPLTGAAPPFPWDEFSVKLAKAFDRSELIIRPGEITWRAKEELYEGLGDAPFPLIFSIPSLRDQVCWVMPAQEMKVLAALLLTQETHPLTFHDPVLQQSFYHFLALEVLYQLTQVSFDKTLSPLLTHLTTLPNQDSLTWDISIQLAGQTIWGRLIIPPEFRRSWVEHFAQKMEASSLTQNMSQIVDLIVHVEAGKTHMNLQEWKDVQLGDFILLDNCSLDIEDFKGRVMLTINGKPAFRAKLKEGHLKILELPLLHEVETPMAKQPENPDEDDLSDLNLPDEEEFDEDLFAEDEDLLSEEEMETQAPTEAKEGLQEETAATPPTKSALAPEQIPITLVVEVGQMQMTMDQLLKLEPGNLLEVDLHPENGVNLTVNGKVVGRGELIRIGEAIGVRVLELGR